MRGDSEKLNCNFLRILLLFFSDLVDSVTCHSNFGKCSIFKGLKPFQFWNFLVLDDSPKCNEKMAVLSVSTILEYPVFSRV